MNETIQFLTDTPVGTKMYLVIQNRVLTEVWIKEAIYQGFTKHYHNETWSDVHVAPTVIKVTDYHVKFTVDGKPITVVCNSPAYWHGQRGYDTDEHLECGANYKTKMHVNVSGCIDVYFTTNQSKLNDYCNNDSAFANILKNLDDQINMYQKMKDDLTNTLAKVGVTLK